MTMALASKKGDAVHGIDRLPIKKYAVQALEIALPALIRVDIRLPWVAFGHHRCLSYRRKRSDGRGTSVLAGGGCEFDGEIISGGPIVGVIIRGGPSVGVGGWVGVAVGVGEVVGVGVGVRVDVAVGG
jgi:hypothetical protein